MVMRDSGSTAEVSQESKPSSVTGAAPATLLSYEYLVRREEARLTRRRVLEVTGRTRCDIEDRTELMASEAERVTEPWAIEEMEDFRKTGMGRFGSAISGENGIEAIV